MFFPEGTSTDGKRVLPFKSTLFAAFFAEGLRDNLWIQPVRVSYHGPEGEDPRASTADGAIWISGRISCGPQRCGARDRWM